VPATARAAAITPGASQATSRPRTWSPPALVQERLDVTPLSPDAFEAVSPRLARATSRDDVTDVLLTFFGSGFSRVLLFIHTNQELRGHDCRGADLLPEAVRQVRIPAGGPSLFSRAIQSKAPYFGPLRGETPIDVAFAQAMGNAGGNVLVLPIVIGGKVPLLVFAMGTQHAVDPRSIAQLAAEVASALQRILMERKTTSGSGWPQQS
jgi:hypothetical protein